MKRVDTPLVLIFGIFLGGTAVFFLLGFLFGVFSNADDPEITATARPTVTSTPVSTAIPTVPPDDVFKLADMVEATNDWWKSDERIIKRCITISGHQEDEFGDTWRSVSLGLQAMEDDLMDGRIDEFTVDEVERKLALVAGVAAQVVMCAAEQ